MAEPTGSYVMGVDLGGTRLRTALADRLGRIVRQRAAPTGADAGRDAVIGRIVAEVRATLDPAPLSALSAIAVGVPGPVDPKLGMVYRPPNLPGWGNVPLRTILTEELSVPVQLGNDGNLAALAEHRFGAGRGISTLVYLTVSTGVGAGVIDADRLVLGSWGGAAEIGHMTIDLNGPRCTCGNFGCLEAMASGTAIANEAARRLAAGEESSLAGLVRGDAQKLRAEQVVEAAERGDPLARAVVEWASYNLGVGVANVLHLFDPELVVIGGGVSNAWNLIQAPVRRAIRERAMEAYSNRARLVRTSLGDDVGVLGAVALALEGRAIQLSP
jgi:glucokinase